MTKHSKTPIFLLFVCCFLMISNSFFAQKDEEQVQFRNQISTNLALPIFSSFDFNYERTIANKWAIGLGGAIYGDRFRELNTVSSSYYRYATTYEITPFARFYFQGAQHKSHFVEIFGSISEVVESGRYVRTTNAADYGVYHQGTKVYYVGGLGTGYGYRFLLMDEKLVLEAQIGIRTNFDVDFLFLNGALVRTGIKVGYRF